MEKYDSKKPGKLIKLNFNLKNEIFDYIPVDQILTKIIFANKTFIQAIFSKKHYKYLKTNFTSLTRKVNFTLQRTSILKEEFSDLFSNENSVDEIISFLLIFKFKNVKFLNFHIKDEEQLDLPVIALFIASHKGLQKLHFSGKFNQAVLAEQFCQVFKAIEKNKSLKELALNKGILSEFLDEAKIDSLFKILASNQTIEVLELDKNKLGKQPNNSNNVNINNNIEAQNINSNIEINKSENLNYNNNDTNNLQIISNISSLSQMISTNTTLKNLNLRWNPDIRKTPDFSKFTLSLGLNSTLKVLDISKMRLGKSPEAFALLCEALQKNKSIEFLNLQTNHISDHNKNLALLAKIISENKSLKKLYLDRNFLGRRFADFKLICDALQRNKSIKILSLDENEIGNDLENSNFLSKLITKNKTLEVLRLSGNNLCDFDYEVLRKAFMKNNKLKEIDVTYNDFEEEFYNKLIDDNPGKKICLQNGYYHNYSSNNESSGREWEDVEDEEMEEEVEEIDNDIDFDIEDEAFWVDDEEEEDD